jgi:hypothetical protein
VIKALRAAGGGGGVAGPPGIRMQGAASHRLPLTLPGNPKGVNRFGKFRNTSANFLY